MPRLKELLTQDRVLKVYGLGQFVSAKFVEVVAIQGGFEAVWLDQEHAGLTIEQIEQAALAARAWGLDSFVRLAPTDYASVMRPLEAGAGGIMAAQVRSAKQVAEIIGWAKFHPRGLRGVNSLGVDGRYGSMPHQAYLEKANAETFVAIQIEHVDALEEVENIAALADLDLLFIGPADLCQSMGIPGHWEHPRLWEAIERVARAARDHGKAWAMLAIHADQCRRCVQLGCRCLSIGFDSWTIHEGLKATKKQYAEFF